MRRFRLLFLFFTLVVLGPVVFLVQRALHSVRLERQMRHQALAERVFDEMERALSRLLEGEEKRPFEEYAAARGAVPPFVIGHFQIDPDGSINAAPIARANEQASARGVAPSQALAASIEQTVQGYWRAGGAGSGTRPAVEAQLPGTTMELRQDDQPKAAGLHDRLASKEAVSAFDALRSLNKGVLERAERQREAGYDEAEEAKTKDERDVVGRAAAPASARESNDTFLDSVRDADELPPMAGRVVDATHLLLYRTVVRETRGYRQGLLLDVERLSTFLREQGLGNDGLTAYAEVTFATPFSGAAASTATAPALHYQHRFAEPFDGLTARLALQPLPGLGSLTYVYALAAMLLATAVLGLGALYRMVSVVVSYAERRSSFVAAVSHELKTPLTAIRMYGEMLRDGMVPSEAKRAEYYRHITVESERLSRLINNVLELARLEKGTREMALVVGSVAPVMGEVADLLRPHVEGAGFELCLDVDADLPPVRYERDALMQVLWNLIDNAVKYARDASPKRIELRGRHDAGNVYVSVRDHGAGVAARHLGKIFEPFYRGESEMTRRSKGTGLGLALVRGLVERMGARVTGRNAADGGFEVEIIFPSPTERR